MATTKIPYCDATWDLTIGCRKRSPGCENCWATRTVHRLACKGEDGYCTHDDRITGRTDREPRIGRIQTAPDGREWLATPEVNLLHWNLDKPLHWRKGRFIFVNSKSDLFDERVPFEFLAKVFDTMARTKQHKYMVLTKEPSRLADFIEWLEEGNRRCPYCWPEDFAHVILMTSIEDAEHLGRLDTLLRISAAHYGVSLEPLLGPVSPSLGHYLWRDRIEDDGLDRYGQLLDWVVVGSEKLLGGRVRRWAGSEVHAWWQEAAAIIHLCRRAQIPVWMKQGPCYRNGKVFVSDRHGDWPMECRIQQHPNWNSSL